MRKKDASLGSDNSKNARPLDKQAERETLRWILRVSRPALPTVLAIVIGEALWAVFGTATALFTREIINGATRGDRSHMLLYLAVYFTVALVLLGVHAFMRYLTEKCRARLEILFRTRVFGKMLSVRYPEISEYHTGELVNRLTGDVSVISEAATTIVPNVVMITVRLVCAMVVLLRLEWRFGAVFLLGGLLIFAFAHLIKAKVQHYHSAMQQADGRTRSFWQEIFENLTVVKAFAGESGAVARADVLMNEHYKLRMKRSLLSTLSLFGTTFVVRMGHLFAIGYGAICLFHGSMDFGTLTALNQLVGQVQQPFANMTGILPRYYAALSSAERLRQIEGLPEDVGGKAIDAQGVYASLKVIEGRNVTFCYDKEQNVLEDCSFTVHKGDFVSVTGMSGIGKSTLFKVLLDLYPVKAGEAYLDTADGKISLDGTTRTLFAYVPQGNMLFSGTLRDNLMFLTPESTANGNDERIHKALACACAEEFVAALPRGLDSVIGENGVGLSEGQVQRLSLARAVLSEAPILLLDEATSALDEATEAQVLSNLRDLKNRTCIIVTHKKAALGVCNRHFVIENKRLKEKMP